MPDKPVSVRTQVILGYFPLLNFYAFYRIRKILQGVAIVFGIGTIVYFAVSFTAGIILVLSLSDTEAETLLNEEVQTIEGFSEFIAYVVSTGFGVYFLRKWSKEWNAKFLTSEQIVKPTIHSLEILKERYAKGDINKEEFDRMKEDLKD